MAALTAHQLANLAQQSGADVHVVEAIAREIAADAGRTGARIVAIAARHSVSPATARMIAEAIDSPTIFESAPERNPTMSTASQVILDAVRRHGATPPAISTIRRLMPNLTEGDAAALASKVAGIGESAPTGPVIEESVRLKAERFAADVQAAAAKPISSASITDLQNLAAAASWF